MPRALPPIFIAVILPLLFFLTLSSRLRPLIRTMAVSRATNLVSGLLSDVVDDCLTARQAEYPDFVLVERNQQGDIVSLSGNPQASSGFKRDVIDALIPRLETLGCDQLGIPLGTLTGRLLFSGLGPKVRVSLQAVGDVTASYESSFSSAGVNQTIHRISLTFQVILYLLIPGEIVPVTVEERVPVAETVIVGQVPDAYIQLDGGA